ncbi:MAG: hypothetical protein J1E95_06500, partial [Muribaculaceae bacterium]|nr:hypothetical protein [Muribaculaceae bacterium]
NMYWLDRNIGAKNNKMYVDNGSHLESEKGLGGLYYTVATAVSYDTPMIDMGMCPRGYHIPSTSEWNNLRLSSDFVSRFETDDKGSTYMSTYFDTNDPKIGKVYFPKGCFLNDTGSGLKSSRFSEEPNSGDNSSGYYWTATEAPGKEKEQMGNWLRALYINGASTSYMDGSILDHQMYVRCVSGTKVPPQDNNYISFNVHNVTHVYLFDENGSALYTFPGKPVGTSKSSVKWQYFYCTTSADKSNLRVIFTNVDEKGNVTIFTKNGNSFDNDKTYFDFFTNKENFSWTVGEVQGKYLDFCDFNSEAHAKNPEIGNIYEKESDIKPNENCSGNTSSSGGGNTGGEDGEDNNDFVFPKNTKFTFHWSYKYEDVIHNYIFGWDMDSKKSFYPNDKWNNGWLGIPADVDSDHKYYKEVTLDQDYKGFYIVVRWYENDAQHDESRMRFDITYNGDGTCKVTSAQNKVSPCQKLQDTPPTQTITGELNSDGIYEFDITLFDDGTTTDSGSTGGGDSGGGDNPEPPGSVTKYDPTDPSEQTVWEGSYECDGWTFFLEINGFNIVDWQNVPVNTIVRVYITPLGDTNWWHVGFCDGNTSDLPNNEGKQFDSPKNYQDFTLSETILDYIKENNGLGIAGQKMIITAVSLRQKD